VEAAVPALGPFQQFGAMGLVAGLMLLLMVGIFKVLVNNVLKTNTDLLKQNFDIQMQTLGALNAIKTEVTAMKTELSADIRELDHTMGQVFNEVSGMTGGSRGYAVGKPPPPGSGIVRR
jgi:hypothetical protein